LAALIAVEDLQTAISCNGLLDSIDAERSLQTGCIVWAVLSSAHAHSKARAISAIRSSLPGGAGGRGIAISNMRETTGAGRAQACHWPARHRTTLMPDTFLWCVTRAERRPVRSACVWQNPSRRDRANTDEKDLCHSWLLSACEAAAVKPRTFA
jgi:hypothetical protein